MVKFFSLQQKTFLVKQLKRDRAAREYAYTGGSSGKASKLQSLREMSSSYNKYSLD